MILKKKSKFFSSLSLSGLTGCIERAFFFRLSALFCVFYNHKHGFPQLSNMLLLNTSTLFFSLPFFLQ